MSLLQQKIGPSIVQTLIVCIVRFFTIPPSIWQGPKSVQNLFELRLALLEGRKLAIDIMHLHLEGHRRHRTMRAGLGDQVIALRGLPVGVFRVASLKPGTDQAAALVAEGDILRAEAVDLQQVGVSVWYQTPHGHTEKLTGRRLIDPIEQCRGEKGSGTFSHFQCCKHPTPSPSLNPVILGAGRG